MNTGVKTLALYLNPGQRCSSLSFVPSPLTWPIHLVKVTHCDLCQAEDIECRSSKRIDTRTNSVPNHRCRHLLLGATETPSTAVTWSSFDWPRATCRDTRCRECPESRYVPCEVDRERRRTCGRQYKRRICRRFLVVVTADASWESTRKCNLRDPDEKSGSIRRTMKIEVSYRFS